MRKYLHKHQQLQTIMLSNNTKDRSCPLLYYLHDQRYTLSTILSFLNENEGTSLLITNKTWSHRVLPLFQLPDTAIATTTATATTSNNNSNTKQNYRAGGNVRRLKKLRHRYIIMPIQDSSVLLSKLNTKRLAARIKQSKRKKKRSEDEEHNHDRNLTNCCNNFNEYYPRNMTTEEIAWDEWIQSRFIFMANNCNGEIYNKYQWEAKLELLRYRNPPTSCKIPKPNPTFTLPKELQPPKIRAQTILLTSYPRSGNTLLRNLLERITNIVTGSDTRPDRTLSKSLALDHDLVGEGIVSSIMTPIIKTHYPERKGFATYNASRIILLVRNPYDAIDSYWNMCCTNTHTESVVEDIYDLYKQKFEGLVKDEICTWFKFIKYWLDRCDTNFDDSDSLTNHLNGDIWTSICVNGTKKIKGKKGPSLLLIRFEDLISRTEQVLEQVMHHILLEDDNTENTDLHPFWKWRIRHGLDLTNVHTSKSNEPKTCDDDKIITMENKTNGEANTKLDQKNVNTLNLGSYKPRSEKKSSHAAIGKSIRKSRYSQELLSHMQQISQLEQYQMSMENEKLSILELFGYDIPNQRFPQNFDDQFEWSFEKYLNTPDSKHSRDYATINVNAGAEIRPFSSPYGRAMTRWRKSQTCDDTEPFPTVQK